MVILPMDLEKVLIDAGVRHAQNIFRESWIFNAINSDNHKLAVRGSC